MSTILVTGSADGIGLETAQALAAAGHRVVAHARTDERAEHTRAAVPDAAGVVVGDVSVLAQIHAVAERAVALADELPEGAETQVWLATSDEPAALVTGRYLERRRDLRANPAAYDEALRDRLLAVCAEPTGVTLGA